MEPAATGLAKGEDSLKKKYAYKLGGNFVALPITLGTQAVVARMLGPATYGNYSFLNTFFGQVVGFFDSGISAGFYSKLSQRPDEPGLVRFFWGVALAVSTLVLLSVSVAFGVGLRETFWPDQSRTYIWMAAVWGLLTWYSQVINRALDAYGLTVDAEIVRLRQKVFAFAVILLMLWSRWGSLAQFYFYQYAILSFLCVSWAVVLHRHGRTLLPAAKLALRQIADYGREFYTYSGPLMVLGLVGMIDGVLDRWFLQKFSGSIQQGFFGLSSQVGGLCFLVSGAMTPLFWREISRAFSAGNDDEMRRLFDHTVKVMFVITAFLSAFIALQAKNVSLLLGGTQFSQAALPISIMVFYPVHQTYGQLTSSFLLGTGQTPLARNLGIATLLLDIALAFWMLAPPSKGGLGLGAMGLALKVVLTQLLGANMQLWFITKYLRTPFRPFLVHQFCSVALLVAAAWTSTWMVGRVVAGPLLAFLCSGVLYALGAGVLLFLFPSLVCMSRAELRAQISAAQKAVLAVRRS